MNTCTQFIYAQRHTVFMLPVETAMVQCDFWRSLPVMMQIGHLTCVVQVWPGATHYPDFLAVHQTWPWWKEQLQRMWHTVRVHWELTSARTVQRGRVACATRQVLLCCGGVCTSCAHTQHAQFLWLFPPPAVCAGDCVCMLA